MIPTDISNQINYSLIAAISVKISSIGRTGNQ